MGILIRKNYRYKDFKIKQMFFEINIVIGISKSRHDRIGFCHFKQTYRYKDFNINQDKYRNIN